VKLAILFWTYFWPAVLAVNLVASTDRRTQWRVALAYLAVYVPVAAVALARSPDLTAVQLLQHWLVTNAVPTVLLYAFLARRVRAVGPIVLAFAVLALTDPDTAGAGAVGRRMKRRCASPRLPPAHGLHPLRDRRRGRAAELAGDACERELAGDAFSTDVLRNGASGEHIDPKPSPRN